MSPDHRRRHSVNADILERCGLPSTGSYHDMKRPFPGTETRNNNNNNRNTGCLSTIPNVRRWTRKLAVGTRQQVKQVRNAWQQQQQEQQRPVSATSSTTRRRRLSKAPKTCYSDINRKLSTPVMHNVNFDNGWTTNGSVMSLHDQPQYKLSYGIPDAPPPRRRVSTSQWLHRRR